MHRSAKNDQQAQHRGRENGVGDDRGPAAATFRAAASLGKRPSPPVPAVLTQRAQWPVRVLAAERRAVRLRGVVERNVVFHAFAGIENVKK